MGYVKHNAIIVTSWDESNIKIAHERAVLQFGKLVTNINEEAINGYKSFMISPDGSKESFNESIQFDEQRKLYKNFIKTLAYDDGSSNINYVEVWYDEYGNNGIVKEDN